MQQIRNNNGQTSQHWLLHESVVWFVCPYAHQLDCRLADSVVDAQPWLRKPSESMWRTIYALVLMYSVYLIDTAVKVAFMPICHHAIRT